jgi:coiled-coil domain-containing protein 130
MQGFNMGRYVPPEHEGVISANKLAGKNALGARANKSSQGILTVRFEMPFAVWCDSCKPHPMIIGQGVRFNAEKKKIGNYYSSPIFSFRMKHTVCGGWIEIHTDPKNTAYIVVSGGRKRDFGGADEIIKVREDLAEDGKDALEVLEGKVDDRQRFLSDKQRIEALRVMRDRDWSDTYAVNRRLRKDFRVERGERKEAAKRTLALQEKYGLGMELLQESSTDKERALLVEFDSTDPDFSMAEAKSGPLFKRQIKSKEQNTKDKLRDRLVSQTRTVVDPFLNPSGTQTDSIRLASALKRKRSALDLESAEGGSPSMPNVPLVTYDSDSS